MSGSLDPEDLRLRIYHAFADRGRAPGPDRLARELRVPREEVRRAMRALARARHLVLDADDRVVMAHPFSAVPLGFAVMGPRTLWWGGCAWDSFALPHLLPGAGPCSCRPGAPPARARTCGTSAATRRLRHQVAHFLVPAAHMWDDVVHTCANQRIFCSTACVDGWLGRTGSRRGDVLDLGTLWRLAAHWYDGRLERGYVRRDPAAAADYLRSVGLTGPFWGL